MTAPEWPDLAAFRAKNPHLDENFYLGLNVKPNLLFHAPQYDEKLCRSWGVRVNDFAKFHNTYLAKVDGHTVKSSAVCSGGWAKKRQGVSEV